MAKTRQAVGRADDLPADVRDAARVTLRPIGTPLPLGLLALAVGTFVLAGLELHLIPVTQGHKVALVLIAFTAPLQAVSSIYGFLARDPVAATGMGVLSGTWMLSGLTILTSPPGSTSGGLGLLLCASAVLMLVPSITAAMSKIVVSVVMLVVAARFAVTGAYELTANSGVQQAAGDLGLALAGLAVYAALALELEGAAGRTILPTGRWGSGKVAEEGTLAEELTGVQHEAGVSKKL